MDGRAVQLAPLTVLLLAALGAAAGGLGALVGIGGGVLLVPALIVLFGFDVRVAIATSLVAVIATSTAAGAVYVAEGQTNMRLGMTLEIATTIGGITGGLVATSVPQELLAGLLAAVLLVTAALLARRRSSQPQRRAPAPRGGAAGDAGGDRAAAPLGRLGGTYHDERTGRLVTYRAQRVAAGSFVSALAGLVSGLLGVGGGFLKVPAMHLVMGIPVKVAAATSNFMIGVTALSSIVVYATRGFVHPYLAAPVALGVVGGALAGTRLQGRSSPTILRRVLAVLLVAVAGVLLASRVLR